MKLICKEECVVKKSTLRGSGWTLFSSILLLFMPKCALCWAAYMSLLSSLGLAIHYQPWFLPVTVILFILTLAKLLWAAVKRKNYLAFILALAAGFLIIGQKYGTGMDSGKILAILLMTAAVMMDKLISLYKQMSFRAPAE
ncbi:MAG: hypothetical protein ABI687_12250 [Flavitalea sp.]